MERFPEMTSKVTTLARVAGMEDPGRVADDVTRLFELKRAMPGQGCGVSVT